MVTIADLSDKPKYTIKAVSSQTGVRPVTLRAWERRYDILIPYRSDNKYRLYSDRDVAILRWIKHRVDSGLSISSSVSEFKTMQQSGSWPEVVPNLQPVSNIRQSNSTSQYATQLFKALSLHDETGASDVLREAHAIFDLTTICLDVITPCLVEIGEAWHRGDIRLTTEHFASAFLRGKLLTLLQAYPSRRGAPTIIIGCATNEQHEIGSLILAVLLRRDGFRVEYLGQDVLIEDLIDYARYEHPALISLSATTETSALELIFMQEKLSKIRPAPIFGYGGRVFNVHPEMRSRVSGVFLGENLLDAVKNIHQLLRI
jgi:MerR family transcriptional regulator, light-induced transcriptional regulator